MAEASARPSSQAMTGTENQVVESRAFSAAPTPDLVRCQSNQGESDEDSASVDQTPTDTTQSTTRFDAHDLLATIFPVGTSTGSTSSSTTFGNTNQSKDDEASRIHDLDLLFGDFDASSSSATVLSASQPGSSPAFSVPSGPGLSRPLNLVLPQGEGKPTPGATGGSSQVVAPNTAPPPASQVQASPLPVSILPAPKRRGRPRKHPLPTDEFGNIILPPKPASKRKAPAADGSTTKKKRATKTSNAQNAQPSGASATTSSIPLSVPDLARLIPHNATPESTQEFIRSNVKLFADLFLALQKQAEMDRKMREETRSRLKGIARSRSVDVASLQQQQSTATPELNEDQARISRSQSVPIPGKMVVPASAAAAMSSASEPVSGLTTPATGQTKQATPDALWIALQKAIDDIAKCRPDPSSVSGTETPKGQERAQQSQTAGIARSESQPSATSLPSVGSSSTPNFSEILSEALSSMDSGRTGSPAPVASQPETGTPSSKKPQVAPNDEIREEVKRRMAEVASGHESLRDEVLRLKVDMQYFETAHKTVDERIQVLRARIASRSEELRKEREARKDRKAAEKMLRDAEQLEKQLEAQAEQLERELARERDDKAASETETEARPDQAADGDTNQSTLSDEKLASLLGISLTDLSNYAPAPATLEAAPSETQESTAFDLDSFLASGLPSSQ